MSVVKELLVGKLSATDDILSIASCLEASKSAIFNLPGVVENTAGWNSGLGIRLRSAMGKHWSYCSLNNRL